MIADVLALAGLLLAPAAMLLGFLAVAGLIVIGLADAGASGGRLVRPPSADRRP